MKKMMIVCGLVIGLPLTALADDMIDKELNGLDIDVQVTGADSAGPGPGASGGVQLLRVTNNSDTVVSCELHPGPSESVMDKSPAMTIEPGEGTAFDLESGYSSATVKAKLVCTPKK